MFRNVEGPYTENLFDLWAIHCIMPFHFYFYFVAFLCSVQRDMKPIFACMDWCHIDQVVIHMLQYSDSFCMLRWAKHSHPVLLLPRHGNCRWLMNSWLALFFLDNWTRYMMWYVKICLVCKLRIVQSCLNMQFLPLIILMILYIHLYTQLCVLQFWKLLCIYIYILYCSLQSILFISFGVSQATIIRCSRIQEISSSQVP